MEPVLEEFLLFLQDKELAENNVCPVKPKGKGMDALCVELALYIHTQAFHKNRNIGV